MERVIPLGAPSFSPHHSEPYPPLFEKFTRDLSQEPGRTLYPLLGVTVWPDGGVKKIELVFSPGDRHIKKAPLFLDILIRFQGSRARKHSVGQPHNEHRLPLEAFRLMNR